MIFNWKELRMLRAKNSILRIRLEKEKASVKLLSDAIERMRKDHQHITNILVRMIK